MLAEDEDADSGHQDHHRRSVNDAERGELQAAHDENPAEGRAGVHGKRPANHGVFIGVLCKLARLRE